MVASHKNGNKPLVVARGASLTLTLLQADAVDGKFEEVGPTVCVTAAEATNIEADCLVARFAIGNMTKALGKGEAGCFRRYRRPDRRGPWLCGAIGDGCGHELLRNPHKRALSVRRHNLRLAHNLSIRIAFRRGLQGYGHGRQGKRLLAYGADYTIKDNCVMTFVPAGHSIMLWMTEPVETALAGAGRKAMAQKTILPPAARLPKERRLKRPPPLPGNPRKSLPLPPNCGK